MAPYAIVAGLLTGIGTFIMMMLACHRDFGRITVFDSLFFTMLLVLNSSAVAVLSNIGGLQCAISVIVVLAVWAISTKVWRVFE